MRVYANNADRKTRFNFTNNRKDQTVNNALTKTPTPNFNTAPQFALWLLGTLAYMLCAPWLVLAIACISAGVMGASADDARQLLVNIATTSSDGWVGLAAAWKVWTVTAMVGVLLVRIASFNLFHAAVNRAGDLVQVWCERRFPRANVAAKEIAVGALMIGFGLLVWSLPKPLVSREVNRKMTPVIAKQAPQASAALQLGDGSLKTGDAEVTANADGSYTVRFK